MQTPTVGQRGARHSFPAVIHTLTASFLCPAIIRAGQPIYLYHHPPEPVRVFRDGSRHASSFCTGSILYRDIAEKNITVTDLQRPVFQGCKLESISHEA